jgi:hypothetical protein
MRQTSEKTKEREMGGQLTDCKESILCWTRSLTSSRARAKVLSSSFFALSSDERNSSGISVFASLHSCAFCSLCATESDRERGENVDRELLHSLAILLLEISSLSLHSCLNAFNHTILSFFILITSPSLSSSRGSSGWLALRIRLWN